MIKYFLSFIIFTVSLNLYAQTDSSHTVNAAIPDFDVSNVVDSDYELEDCSNSALNLPSSNWGLSFGNSKDFTGIRINTSECGIGTINGLNITLWSPKYIYDSNVNGISIGIAPSAGNLTGFQFGIVAAIANNNMTGLNYATLALISEENMTGINLSGLALISGGNLTGINFSGLASVAEGDLTGINFSGLAIVSNKNLTGINFSGIASVAGGNLTGINISGIASVCEGNITGLNLGGIALVSNQNITGFNFGLGALVSNQNITGINISLGGIVSKNVIGGLTFNGYKTECENMWGFNTTIGITKAYNFAGFSISGLNNFSGSQSGISIGLVNIANSLSGIQLGLINVVKSNPAPFRILPFINFGM